MVAVDIEQRDDPAACRAVEALQRAAWGMPDRGVVPAEIVRATTHNGGVLLLANRGGRPVGFCFAFVGIDDGEPILCSHMLAVDPDAQSAGIGQALKWAQYDVARARGFDRITWTFDPLQARNAHLNLRVLGAYARRYHVDHYGPMDDAINAGLPTDRLLAEWPVTDDRRGIDRPAARRGATEDSTGAERWALDADRSGRHVRPGRVDHGALDDARGGGAVLVAVPSRVAELGDDDHDAVLAWRMAVREVLTAALTAGLVAVDLRRDAAPGVAAYVLSGSGGSDGDSGSRPDPSGSDSDSGSHPGSLQP